MAKLTIEVANTPLELAHGLMHRQTLADNSGMLFKFPHLTEAQFWGKNTYIPLDIAFIGIDNRITGIKKIAPMSTRLIHSDGLCVMAVETNAGFFDQNDVKLGHRIYISDNMVEFKEC